MKIDAQQQGGGAIASEDLLAVAFQQGQDANDHNRRVFRQRHSGTPKSNPYLNGSDQHRRWNEGYQYRDMVNDG